MKGKPEHRKCLSLTYRQIKYTVLSLVKYELPKKLEIKKLGLQVLFKSNVTPSISRLIFNSF